MSLLGEIFRACKRYMVLRRASITLSVVLGVSLSVTAFLGLVPPAIVAVSTLLFSGILYLFSELLSEGLMVKA